VKRLAIVGGGITGLSAAWRARSLSKNVQITLIEKEPVLGGKIQTEARDGFVLEAGADGFLSRKAAGMELCRQLGVMGLVRGQIPRRRRSFVMRARELHPLPEGFSGLVPSNGEALEGLRLLSEPGKLRLMQEPTIPARVDPTEESVQQFMTRRFGKEAFDSLIEPLLAGIFAGDASSLSLDAAFPNLRELERRHGSVMSAPRQPASSELTPFVTLAPGMAELVRAASRALDSVQVSTAAEARAITRRAGRWRVEIAGRAEVEADAVIVAVPASCASTLLAGTDAALGEALESIPFASTALIHLAFQRAEIRYDLDGYGYVIPRAEGSDFLACTWTSSKWEGRAPKDTVLVRLYAGRFGKSDILKQEDGTLISLAREELHRTMGIEARPMLARVFRWHLAMPQYTLGHLQRLQAIQSRCAGLEGLHVAGASYRGVGIPDCIESGSRAARDAMEQLE
jgi:oxygen-dependent protoporphyrinogen oxidase